MGTYKFGSTVPPYVLNWAYIFCDRLTDLSPEAIEKENKGERKG